MGVKLGQDLGGIRTVDDLMQRCYVDPLTDCWHCRMHKTSGGMVQFTFTAPDTGQRFKMMGRRAALYLSRGKMIPKSHIAYAADRCESLDCVNPKHCRTGTKQQWGAEQKRLGRLSTPAKIASALARAKERRILTPEQVRIIRRSDASAVALAAQMGVSSYAVWSARTGRSHRNIITAPNSVFDQAA